MGLKLKYSIIGILSTLGLLAGAYFASGATWFLPPQIQRGDLLVATSTTQAVRLATGSAGSVLSIVNNVPKWVATSTLGFTGNGGSGATTTINSATGPNFTFATSSDANILFNITSGGSTATFTPAWTGTLAVSRGGTGVSSVYDGYILMGSTSPDTLTTISNTPTIFNSGSAPEWALTLTNTLRNATGRFHTESIPDNLSMDYQLPGSSGTLALTSQIPFEPFATDGLEIYNGNDSSTRFAINSSTPASTILFVGEAGINPFVVASSTGISLFTIGQNGSTTLSSLGSGVVRSASGSLFNGKVSLTADVTGVLPLANGGLATTTLGNLTVSSSNLSITGGQQVLIGTSTQITLSDTPTFTKGTFTNASTTNLTISNILFTPGMANGCLQVSSGIATSTGTNCGSGGSGNSAWTIGNGVIYNATSTDLVNIGTSTMSATLSIQGKGGANILSIASSTGQELFTINQIGQVLATTGTASLPGYSFIGDSDTGIYHSAANTLDVTAGGTNSFTFTNTSLTANNGADYFGDNYYSNSPGSLSAPDFSLNTDSQTGIFLPGGGVIGFTSSNSEKARFTGTGFAVGTTTTLTKLAVTGSPTVDPFEITSTSGTSLLRFTQSGNLGIATTTPQQPLVVVGSSTITSLNASNCDVKATLQGGLYCGTDATGASTGNAAWTIGNGLIYNATSTDLVGIGTITPTTTLFVQGKGGANPFSIVSSTGSTLLSVAQNGSTTINSLTAGVVYSTSGGSLFVDSLPGGTNCLDEVGGIIGVTGSGDCATLGGNNNFTGLNTFTATTTLATTTITNLTVSQAPVISAFGAGVVHSSSAGLLSSSAIVNSDIQNATIDLAAKVTGVLPIANGGTATTASPTVIGQLLGSHGSGSWGVTNLVAGSNITLTTSTPGQITIASTGGGSGNSAWTIGSGLIYNATSTDLVGIGTNSPTTTLFVQGKGGVNPFTIASSTGSTLMYMDQLGNVGLGTTTYNSGPGTLNANTVRASTFTAVYNEYGTTLGTAIRLGSLSSVYIGPSAGNNNEGSTGHNIVIGQNAGDSLTSGSVGDNTLVGFDAGTSITTADQSVFIGHRACKFLQTGTSNTCVGVDTGSSQSLFTSGDGNVFLGDAAGGNNGQTTGDANTYLGTGAGGTIDGISTSTAIGYLASVSTSSQLQIAKILTGLNINTSAGGNIGINTTTPINALSVIGVAGTANPFVVSSSTGTALFTVASNGSTTINSLANCSGKVITDSTGSLYCGTDQTSAGGGTVTTSTVATTNAIPIWTGANTLGNSTLAQSAGLTTLSGVPIINGGGIWISDIAQSSGANFITQSPTSTMVAGNFTQGGGVQYFQATTYMTPTQFCSGGLFNISSSTALNIYFPTLTQLAPGQAPANCTNNIYGGQFAQQFAVNSGSASYTINASGTGETLLYAMGSGPTIYPGMSQFAQGQFTATSTINGATSTGMTFNAYLGTFQPTSTAPSVMGQILSADATGHGWQLTNLVAGTGITIATSTANQITVSASNAHTGTGTNGFAAIWTGANALSTAKLIDNGSVIGMNATSSTIGFNIQGTAGTNSIFNLASSSGSSVFNVAYNGTTTMSGSYRVASGTTETHLTINPTITMATNSTASMITVSPTVNSIASVTLTSLYMQRTIPSVVLINPTSTLTSYYQDYAQTTFTTGTITSLYQLYLDAPSVNASSTLTNVYGIIIAPSSSTTKYTVLNGIGSTTPMSTLSIQSQSGQTAPIFAVASSSNLSFLQVTAGGQVLLDPTARLTIPQGSNPTLSAAGDIAQDTTQDQLLYGSQPNVLMATSSKTMTIIAPTASEDDDFFITDVPITITKVQCSVRNQNTSSFTFNLPHGTNRNGSGSAGVFSSGTACTGTSTPQTISITGDNTLAAGEILWATSSATTLASTTSITVWFKYDRQ